MNEEKKNEENTILTDNEIIPLREVGGVSVFRFPKDWLKVLKSKLPQPMELHTHLEETPQGTIRLVAELRKK